MKLRTIIANRKKALKSAHPKRRDKARHQLKVALVAQQLRREG